jgi:hypothetical protein
MFDESGPIDIMQVSEQVFVPHSSFVVWSHAEPSQRREQGPIPQATVVPTQAPPPLHTTRHGAVGGQWTVFIAHAVGPAGIIVAGFVQSISHGASIEHVGPQMLGAVQLTGVQLPLH